MNYNNVNFILMADSYKYSHAPQLPANSEFSTAYFESRGSNDPDYKVTVWFGIQMAIKKYFLSPITSDDVDEAALLITAHGEPFDRQPWDYIVDELAGKIPVSIESVPEGTVLPLRNVLYQVTNTVKGYAWLPAFVETTLVRDGGWYPTTVATLSYTIKQFMKETYDRTGSVEGLDFKLHDFGQRGVSSFESAGTGGIAHLINFKGTDTIASLLAGRKYYDIDMAGLSIQAGEHSVYTAWGEAAEAKAYSNAISLIRPDFPIIAIVGDAYDMYNAAENIFGGELKEQIEKSGGTVVVRPDSGDPTTVPIDIIEIFMSKFGYTTNDKGFRTLPSCIRVIQGDGINKESIKQILANLEKAKMTLDNLAFGMGGALLQGVNRDTLKFAQKMNSNVINGVRSDVYKRPATDSGKASKAGQQALVFDEYEKTYETVRLDQLGDRPNVLREIYRDGELLIEDNFETIRTRTAT